MIKIICFGKIKDPSVLTLCKEYEKRIKPHFKLEIIEWKESKKDDDKIITFSQKDKSIIYLLDERGMKFTSIELSELINQHNKEVSNITFIIAGAEGFSDKIKKMFPNKISLSSMTLTHEIARLIFFEQIYRSATILKNIPYHKD